MKHIFRLTIILGISLLGELMAMLIPLPVPGCIYGLILMLLALVTRIVPLEAVQVPGRFLVEIMPAMFIPAAVALVDSWQALRSMLLPTVVITLVSTFAVMGVTGRVTQSLMRKGSADEKEDAK